MKEALWRLKRNVGNWRGKRIIVQERDFQLGVRVSVLDHFDFATPRDSTMRQRAGCRMTRTMHSVVPDVLPR